MMNPFVRFEYTTDDFFNLPPKKISIEDDQFTGRVYFIFRGWIVAVAMPTQEPAQEPFQQAAE